MWGYLLLSCLLCLKTQIPDQQTLPRLGWAIRVPGRCGAVLPGTGARRGFRQPRHFGWRRVGVEGKKWWRALTEAIVLVIHQFAVHREYVRRKLAETTFDASRVGICHCMSTGVVPCRHYDAPFCAHFPRTSYTSCADRQFRYRGEVRVSGLVCTCCGMLLVLRNSEAIPTVLQQGPREDTRRGRNRQRNIRTVCRRFEGEAHAADACTPDLHCRRVQ